MPFITNYAKAQRIQWFGHAMRKEETNEARVAIECHPSINQTVRRPRGRPKMDGWNAYVKI